MYTNADNNLPEHKRKKLEAIEEEVALFDEKIKETEKKGGRDQIADWSDGDAPVTIEEVNDTKSYSSGNRGPLRPVGFIPRTRSNGAVFIDWVLRSNDSQSVKAGFHCGRCLQPQVDHWTPKCRRANAPEGQESCGYPRGGGIE